MVPPVRGVVAGTEFTVRCSGDSQKLHHLLVPSANKPFADVEHHGNACAVHLSRKFGIAPEIGPSDQGTDPVALCLRCLPDPKILEAIDTHAPKTTHAGCQGWLMAQGPWLMARTKDRGPGTDRGPRTKDQGL